MNMFSKENLAFYDERNFLKYSGEKKNRANPSGDGVRLGHYIYRVSQHGQKGVYKYGEETEKRLER